jgi:hypothetical protein
MTEPTLRPARRKTERRWRVPPVLTHGPEGFEGLAVLDELPGDGGVLLWQALRDVTLWAQAPAAARGALFHGAVPRARRGDVPAPVESSFRVLEALARHPASAEPGVVAAACREVALWAEAGECVATALGFAQAAALSEPIDPPAALEVARLARRRCEDPRAETWYRRTVAVARQRGDWSTYARAFQGLGALYVERGNLAGARRFYLRALRAAGRNGLRELEASALHELFRVAAQGRRRREALRMAEAAREVYGAGHPALPRLAHDVARHWLVAGHFGRALPVLRAVVPRAHTPAQRAAALADLARAVAATGGAGAFVEAWSAAWELVRDEPAAPGHAGSLLSLAAGAAALGVWDKAEAAAREAVRRAAHPEDAATRAAAEALLECVHRRAAPPAPPAAEPPGVAAASDALATALVRALVPG